MATCPDLAVRLVFDCDHPSVVAAWQALDGKSEQPDFFQSAGWCSHVARVRLRADPKRYRPVIAVAFAGAEPRGLWPLSLQKAGAMMSLCNLDDPYGQFAGLLSVDDASAAALVAGTLSQVRQRHLAHYARIERVIKDSPLEKALLSLGVPLHPTTQAPYIDLGSYQNFAELKLTRNKKTMKNLRNAINRLNRIGDLTAVTSTAPAEVSRIAGAAYDNRKAWLVAKGQTAPAFRSPTYREIIRAEGSLDNVGFELSSNNTSIAQQIGYVHGGRYYAYLSGMDLSKSELMPGKVHLGLVIELILAKGLKGIEFLSPASDYKLTWTTSVRELADATVSLSPLGSLRLYFWDGGLRPALKRAFHSLSPGLKKTVARALIVG